MAADALAAVVAQLRSAKAALPRLLPGVDPQSIDKFFSRTVDASGAASDSTAA